MDAQRLMEWERYLCERLHHKIRFSRMTTRGWKAVSSHPIFLSMVADRDRLSWDWKLISRQDDPAIRSLLLRFPDKSWDWNHLSRHLPMEFIHENAHLPWNLKILWVRLLPSSPSSEIEWSRLSASTDLSIILHDAFLPWDWHEVSRHPQLTMDHVYQQPHLRWDFPYIMTHTPFFFNHLAYPILQTDCRLLSSNPHHHPALLKRFLQCPWDWKALARHPAFPPHLVVADPVLSSRWRWDHCLLNPRLTLGYYHVLRKTIHIPDHFSLLSRNPFDRSPNLPLYFMAVRRRFLLRLVHRRRLRLHLKFFLSFMRGISRPMVWEVLSFL